MNVHNKSSKKSHRRVETVTKAEKIKQTLQQTKEKRKNQIPVVYQLKINLNRDLNSAINMLKAVGLDRSELKPVEWETTAKIFRGNPYILVSHTMLKREA